MNTLSLDVRTGVRAAVAVALASGVAHLFALQRSYWIIIVAVVVLAETWGASIQKAVQRVAATAAGCLIGWQVQRLAGTSLWVQVLMLLLCVFLAIYFRGYSYPLMMFFITIYVVFLFSLLGEWNLSVAIVRLKDTIIGGAVAIAATVIVPPVRADQLRGDLIALWNCSQAQLAAALAVIAPLEQEPEGVQACRDNLYRTVETLQSHIAVSPYENVLRPMTVGRIRQIVEQTEALARHVLVLGHIVQEGAPHRLRPLTPELEAMAADAMQSIRQLASESAGQSREGLHGACDRLQARAEELQSAGQIGTDELLTICSVTFHLQAIGRSVARIVELRRHLPATAVPHTAQDLAVSS